MWTFHYCYSHILYHRYLQPLILTSSYSVMRVYDICEWCPGRMMKMVTGIPWPLSPTQQCPPKCATPCTWYVRWTMSLQFMDKRAVPSANIFTVVVDARWSRADGSHSKVSQPYHHSDNVVVRCHHMVPHSVCFHVTGLGRRWRTSWMSEGWCVTCVCAGFFGVHVAQGRWQMSNPGKFCIRNTYRFDFSLLGLVNPLWCYFPHFCSTLFNIRHQTPLWRVIHTVVRQGVRGGLWQILQFWKPNFLVPPKGSLMVLLSFHVWRPPYNWPLCYIFSICPLSPWVPGTLYNTILSSTLFWHTPMEGVCVVTGEILYT